VLRVGAASGAGPTAPNQITGGTSKQVLFTAVSCDSGTAPSSRLILLVQFRRYDSLKGINPAGQITEDVWTPAVTTVSYVTAKRLNSPEQRCDFAQLHVNDKVNSIPMSRQGNLAWRL
jgi:hypothetical protein